MFVSFKSTSQLKRIKALEVACSEQLAVNRVLQSTPGKIKLISSINSKRLLNHPEHIGCNFLNDFKKDIFVRSKIDI